MQSSAPNSDALTNLCALEAWLDSSLSLMNEPLSLVMNHGKVDATVRDVVEHLKWHLLRAAFPKQIISPVLGLIPVPPDLEVYSDAWFSHEYIAVNIFLVDDQWQYNVFVDKLNPETGLREYNTDVQLCHGICS